MRLETKHFLIGNLAIPIAIGVAGIYAAEKIFEQVLKESQPVVHKYTPLTHYTFPNGETIKGEFIEDNSSHYIYTHTNNPQEIISKSLLKGTIAKVNSSGNIANISFRPTNSPKDTLDIIVFNDVTMEADAFNNSLVSRKNKTIYIPTIHTITNDSKNSALTEKYNYVFVPIKHAMTIQSIIDNYYPSDNSNIKEIRL